jgi:hypothetical protein
MLTIPIIGYPDSAHNLGLIYQGYSNETMTFKDIKKSIEYFERAKQWKYSPSCNARKLMIKIYCYFNTVEFTIVSSW